MCEINYTHRYSKEQIFNSNISNSNVYMAIALKIFTGLGSQNTLNTKCNTMKCGINCHISYILLRRVIYHS